VSLVESEPVVDEPVTEGELVFLCCDPPGDSAPRPTASPALVVAEEPKGDTQVNVPVILAELGFMTNPTEDRLLETHRPTNAVRLLDTAAGRSASSGARRRRADETPLSGLELRSHRVAARLQ
jgi:hypothetical protein